MTGTVQHDAHQTCSFEKEPTWAAWQCMQARKMTAAASHLLPDFCILHVMPGQTQHRQQQVAFILCAYASLAAKKIISLAPFDYDEDSKGRLLVIQVAPVL